MVVSLGANVLNYNEKWLDVDLGNCLSGGQMFKSTPIHVCVALSLGNGLSLRQMCCLGNGLFFTNIFVGEFAFFFFLQFSPVIKFYEMLKSFCKVSK
jgi:hypothetical protein